MFKLFKIAAVAAAGLSLLTACGGGGDEEPGRAGPAYPTINLPAESEVRYGPHERQVADVYIPQNGDRGVKGIAVWIHGGGWIGGNKVDSKPMTQALTNMGVAVVNMNYRLNEDGAYPNSVEDVKTVLAALANGGCATCDVEAFKQLGVLDSFPLFVGGSSAGGYLAVMGGMEHLAVTPREGTCIYNHVGPVDMRIHAETNDFGRQLIEVFAGGDVSSEKLTAMSPVVKLERGAWASVSNTTRFLLSYGINDDFVPLETTRSFTEALRAKGFSYNEVFYDYPFDGGHAVPDAVSRQDLHNAVSDCFNNSNAFES